MNSDINMSPVFSLIFSQLSVNVKTSCVEFWLKLEKCVELDKDKIKTLSYYKENFPVRNMHQESNTSNERGTIHTEHAVWSTVMLFVLQPNSPHRCSVGNSLFTYFDVLSNSVAWDMGIATSPQHENWDWLLKMSCLHKVI